MQYELSMNRNALRFTSIKTEKLISSSKNQSLTTVSLSMWQNIIRDVLADQCYKLMRGEHKLVRIDTVSQSFYQN